VYGLAALGQPPAAATEADLRGELAEVCRLMYRQGYIVATDGNVSARLGEDRLLVTPSGLCKGDMEPGDFVLADLRGEPIDPAGRRPSSEIRLHVAIYEERRDVRAVVHAHPPTCVAFSLAGIEVANCILPEIVIGVGEMRMAPYATPTTQAAADVVRPLVRSCDAIILDRHGSVTVGRDVRSAFYALERIEWAARVTHLARQLGRVLTLPKPEVERLLEVRSKLTGRARRDPCNLCGACVAGTMPY
jgi:L-fuculose-phosphate aldolase